MTSTDTVSPNATARYSGAALLATIIIGILSAVFLVKGIDINLSADVLATAENMQDAELRLRAKAYIAILTLVLEAIVSVGFYLLLRKAGPLLAGSCLFLNLAAAVLALLGAMFAMNGAEIASNAAYVDMANESQRLLLTGLQVTSDYTSFHLSLIVTTAANAGFFYLFLKSGLIPKLVAGWGVFASVFVVTAIIARDFFPVLGHGGITAAFMVSNLVALIAAGLYLAIKGVRTQA